MTMFSWCSQIFPQIVYYHLGRKKLKNKKNEKKTKKKTLYVNLSKENKLAIKFSLSVKFEQLELF